MVEIEERNALYEVKYMQAGAVATLEEHQNALYCLLREFDRVCNALDITYYLFAGTLLGAVRHEGIIPWDDDLDVIMHREDYMRFLAEAPKLLDEDAFFLQGEFSEHFPMFFSKLRLNGTTCLERYHPKDPESHQGVYMDIFPYDNAYSGKMGRYLQFACSKVIIAKGLDARGYTTNSFLKKAMMLVCRMLPKKPFLKVVLGPKCTGKYVHCFLGGASKMGKSVFPAEYFAECMELPFGDGCYCVPRRYDELLKTLYGDYMRIPDEQERRCKKHVELVDLTHSYEYHKAYHDGMTFDASVKSIR